MADGATGTPTSLGIPKYNTGADAPSGRGFNSAMDVLDVLLLARLMADTVTVAGTRIISNKLLVSDSQPNFRILGSGEHQWGPGGSTAPDTFMDRQGAGILRMLNTSFRVDRTNGTDTAFIVRRVADTGGRAKFTADGEIHWGPGDGTFDTNLYRVTADTLRTDDAFQAIGGLEASNHIVQNAGAVYLRGDGQINFGASDDTSLSRTAANELSMGTGDTFKLAAVGLKFNDGTVQTTAAAPATSTVTSLPGSPADGDRVILTDSLTTPAYRWHLQYEAGDGKWHFLGGTPLYAEVQTSETTTSTSYAALTTAGPSVTLPVAGDYMVDIGSATSSDASNDGLHSYDIGGTGAVDADATLVKNSGFVSVMRGRKKTGLTAVTLTSKYKSSAGGTITFQNRWIRVTPVRLG